MNNIFFKTFAQVATSDKDKVSFEINGDILAGFSASELQGKDILLSFQPASSTDQEIYDRYSSIFDIPAYAVYMKPVLLVDNEVVAEGEEYLESTLGARGSFAINLTSGGKNTRVTNDITTGSMYAVTLDSQSITAEELQSVYDEAAALRESVTEENVYSEDYLGKLLNLAGKLYFAQVDVTDTIAADLYDVSVTRSLSEGITGYEVRTSSLYGRVTSLSVGSLYIDVDTDSHSVVSIEGDKSVPREYMMSTGMISSLYESTVWEQMTGHESVSTISILAQAQKNNIEIVVIGKENLSEELQKINVDGITRQEIINAANSGKIVTMPVENVAIGNWSGIGYIVTNPETGAGSYMISGGLNGGSTSDYIDAGFMISEMYLIWSLESAAESLVSMAEIFSCQLLFGGTFGTLVALAGVALIVRSIVSTCNSLAQITELYYDYLLDDSDENARRFLNKMKEIFSIDLICSNLQDGGMETLKWIYIWHVNGGSIY